jgi:hypothetical protein
MDMVGSAKYCANVLRYGGVMLQSTELMYCDMVGSGCKVLRLCTKIWCGVRSELEGDPTSWGKMLFQLKGVHDAVLQRGAGFLVVVVQTLSQDKEAPPELPAERTHAVCQNLGIDPR